MKPLTSFGLAVLTAAIISACSGGSGSSDGGGAPTTPSAIPPGCSGTVINRVDIWVRPGDSNQTVPLSFTVHLNGETFPWPNGDGRHGVHITRDYVPCDYEMTGEMRGTLSGFIDALRAGTTTGQGGVTRGSLVSVEGPFVPVPGDPCKLAFTKPASEPPPYTFKVRFRIGATNGCPVVTQAARTLLNVPATWKAWVSPRLSPLL